MVTPAVAEGGAAPGSASERAPLLQRSPDASSGSWVAAVAARREYPRLSAWNASNRDRCLAAFTPNRQFNLAICQGLATNGDAHRNPDQLRVLELGSGTLIAIIKQHINTLRLQFIVNFDRRLHYLTLRLNV